MELSVLLIDAPTHEPEPEAAHIDLNLEYFAATPVAFLVYSKEKGIWYDFVSKEFFPGRISDIIDAKGDMHLHRLGPISSGKWGTAQTLDPALDLWTTGAWREWLSINMNKKIV